MAGNGLFIMGMARNKKDLNFLGLEINGKVCLIIFLVWGLLFHLSDGLSTFLMLKKLFSL